MSFLEGTYEVDFVFVALGVGVFFTVATLYLVRRFQGRD